MATKETATYTELSNSKPLTTKEAADYCGITLSYLYKLCHEKRIPHYKPLNGKVYFKESELNDFLYRNRIAANYELREQAEQLVLERKR